LRRRDRRRPDSSLVRSSLVQLSSAQSSSVRHQSGGVNPVVVASREECQEPEPGPAQIPGRPQKCAALLRLPLAC
jgi:hypothetical protein